MADKNHSLLIQILERLAKVEERIDANFKARDEMIVDIKEHVGKINDELGSLEKRMGSIERLYDDAKRKYEKASDYWKTMACIVSPIVTFLILCFIKTILHLPIP